MSRTSAISWRAHARAAPACYTSSVVAIPYDVVLYPSEEGFAVQCPALPGCWSQGDSETEALENIADAIHEYLLAVATLPEAVR